MASPIPFHKIICLVIYIGLAWFSVVAKPIELPAVEPPRYMSNLTHVVASVATGGVRNGKTPDVDNLQSQTFAVGTPTCTDPVHDAAGCKVTDATPTAHTIACSPPHCTRDGESVGAPHSILTHVNVATLLSAGNYKYSPDSYPEAPVGTALPAITDSIDTNLPLSYGAAPISEKAITSTAKIPHDQDGDVYEPETTLAPSDAPAPVSGQQTVYVTITDDPTTNTPIPVEPFSNKPLSTGHPESNKTAIILGSVFGSLAILCISIVSVDRLLRRRRQKRDEPQESHENQECQASISSVEDMSELLRQQQQTYGYYGTQRVASSTIVPQQMKSFPISSEPVELPTPKDETLEKERRDGH